MKSAAYEAHDLDSAKLFEDVLIVDEIAIFVTSEA